MQTASVTVSAPGKLMLLGEHAVVYGQPCLVTAVGQRMKATVQLTDDGTFSLEAPDVQVAGYRKQMAALGTGEIPKGAKFVELAVRNFIAAHPLSSGVSVVTSSEFSSQFGFGSSSASTVCVLKALSEVSGAKLGDKELFDLSFRTVLDIQGKGSGFDTAAAIWGGTLYFVTPGKTVEPLKLKALPLIIGYTGIKADTVTLINAVKEKATKYPAVIDAIYAEIGKLVDLAKPALMKGDWQAAGELMDFNQGYLESLGVSASKLSAMIHAAREAGAYGAKLSGAGKGDCMIALAPEEKVQAVKDAITKVGGQVIEVGGNVEGVRVES